MKQFASAVIRACVEKFVSGAGGCSLRPALGEAACDATQGDYRDDDANALGDFCSCPIGTQTTADGCTVI